MTKNKAIQILIGQREKLSDTKFNADVWLSQTKGYAKQFFGENSEQFKFLNDFSFNVFVRTITADKSLKENMLQAKKGSAKQFIDDCIEYLQYNDLHKPPKTNFIHNLSDTALWTIITISLSTVFGGGVLVGQYSTDTKNIELR